MSTTAVDVTRTRSFGNEKYLVKQVPWAIGVIALGGLVLGLARGDDDRGAEGIFLGLFVILAGLVYIGYAFYRRSNPKKPVLELSADGILYRLIQGKEFRIPWNEVEDLGVINIKGHKGAVLRDVTVALVSRDFFDANVPVKSWWARGPGWRYYFIPRDDGKVQIAFHHDVLSVPADELWHEIETRWRGLSAHPDAPLLSVPRVVRARGWIGGWTPSPTQKRVAAAALAVIAAAAIYFWQFLFAWMTFPDLNADSSSYYLNQILDRSGVHARLAGKGMVFLRRSDISGLGTTHCRTEITRDPANDGLTPAYVAAAFCTADLVHVSGFPAKAIFKLTSQTFQSEDWEGKPTEYKAIWPAPMEAAEAEARLCDIGICGDES